MSQNTQIEAAQALKDIEACLDEAVSYLVDLAGAKPDKHSPNNCRVKIDEARFYARHLAALREAPVPSEEPVACATCNGCGMVGALMPWGDGQVDSVVETCDVCNGTGRTSPADAPVAPDAWQDMSCDEQYALAAKIAGNLGYDLTPEPDHPDRPVDNFSSPRSVAPVPSVKGLEWEQNSQNTENSLWANVDSIGRSYTIEPESFVFRVETQLSLSEYGPERLGLHPTLEAAKAVAQADLVRRISPLLASSIIPATKGGEDVDQIITALYRRFKNWSKRGFGPDDVTWCEVKADIIDLVAALAQDTDGVAKP